MKMAISEKQRGLLYSLSKKTGTNFNATVIRLLEADDMWVDEGETCWDAALYISWQRFEKEINHLQSIAETNEEEGKVVEVRTPEKSRSYLYALCKRNNVHFYSLVEETLGQIDDPWEAALQMSAQQFDELIAYVKSDPNSRIGTVEKEEEEVF
jgi:hypothetical protein